MTENEIITQQDPQMQLFSQLMEGILKKLERYCATARPMLKIQCKMPPKTKKILPPENIQ